LDFLDFFDFAAGCAAAGRAAAGFAASGEAVQRNNPAATIAANLKAFLTRASLRGYCKFMPGESGPDSCRLSGNSQHQLRKSEAN
jgi:hypothetical protein